MFIDLSGILNILPHVIFTFILIGYTWAQLEDGKDYPSASHINELQEKKVDKDGEIGYIGTVKWKKGADIASAATLIPGSDGNYFDVTGTTTITKIQAAQSQPGTVIRLHFDASLTIQHDGDYIVIPWGANLSISAGDEAVFVEYATDKWRLVGYLTADGLPAYGPTSSADEAIARFDGTTGKKIQGSTIIIDDNDKMKSIRTATFKAEYDNGTFTTSGTIDWNNGQKQKVVLGGDASISFTDPPGPCHLTLRWLQDATGGRTPSWPASGFEWTDKTEPTWATGANEVNIVHVYFDGQDYWAGGNKFA